jgi:nitroreductase
MNVYQAIRTRRSVRRYSPQPIPENTLLRLRDALRLAPSACNFQPWRFIFVADQKLVRNSARPHTSRLSSPRRR